MALQRRIVRAKSLAALREALLPLQGPRGGFAFVTLNGDCRERDAIGAGGLVHSLLQCPVVGGMMAFAGRSSAGLPQRDSAIAVTIVSGGDSAVVPFRFQKEARDRARVGRYNIASRIEGTFDMAKFVSVSSAPIEPLPVGLAGLVSPASFLLVGDSHCEPYLKALDAAFPTAAKAGVVGQPTPFINGKAHTLFYNDEVVENGLVGVALPFQRMASAQAHSGTLLGEPMRVAKARGNIVVEVDSPRGRNPSQILLELSSSGQLLSKDDAVFLGVSSCDRIPQAVFQVTSGDPKRGPIAVDTTQELREGMFIQVNFAIALYLLFNFFKKIIYSI